MKYEEPIMDVIYLVEIDVLTLSDAGNWENDIDPPIDGGDI